MYLHVIEYNKTALKFYKKNGFEETNVYEDYYNLNDARFNAVVLVKKIRKSNLMLENKNHRLLTRIRAKLC
jgi:ribosomal protein S18 acetylase RimI-like enzyme